jgi:hypothetical protein
MAGFLGNMQVASDISLTGTVSEGSGTCAKLLEWAQTDDPIDILAAPTSTNACFPGASDLPTAGTRMLLVKHTDGRSAGEMSASGSNTLFFRTTGKGGEFAVRSVNDAKADSVTFKYWEYFVNLYYLRDNSDGVPTLYRKRLGVDSSCTTPCTPDMGSEEELVSGVVRMGLTVGLDKAGYNDLSSYTTATRDGIADYYTADLDELSTTPLSEAVSARLDVLMRSYKQDPSYTNDKKYVVGGSDVNTLANSNYHGKVFSVTLHLRNPAYRIQMDNI